MAAAGGTGTETVTSGGAVYQLRFAPGVDEKFWAPGYFNTFTLSRDVKSKLRKRNLRDGVGAELVGVRHPAQPDPFMTPKGI